ncbi:MAG TPA: hypothetical protein VE973_00655, partial [Candidatus Limnocylindria bacterium]|nr:hypothetical protein [Candidatus Limnocylindria bacterium]
MEKRQLNANFAYNLKTDLQGVEEAGRRSIREKKREVTTNAKRELIVEQERIAKTIESLYDSVYHSPDKATAELLMDWTEHHKEGPFSAEVAQNFSKAIENYRKKREAVQRFIGDNYKSSKIMFEKCFGLSPKGKVEAIAGPMSLTFRCFEDEDYFAAYSHGVPDAEGAKAKAIEKASGSGGAAFFSVKQPQLTGCVIAERVHKNFEQRPIYHKREIEISGRQKNSWQRFEYPKGNEA